jgi:hypothetical protein
MKCEASSHRRVWRLLDATSWMGRSHACCFPSALRAFGWGHLRSAQLDEVDIGHQHPMLRLGARLKLRRAKVWTLTGVTRLAEFLGGLFLTLIEEHPHLSLDGHQFRPRSVREEQVNQPPVQCRKLARDFCPPQSRHRTNAIGSAAPDCTPVRVGRQKEVLLMRPSETADVRARANASP